MKRAADERIEGYEARAERMYHQLKSVAHTQAAAEELGRLDNVLAECLRYESPIREELFVYAVMADRDLIRGREARREWLARAA